MFSVGDKVVYEHDLRNSAYTAEEGNPRKLF